jgi:hypothetical protein
MSEHDDVARRLAARAQGLVPEFTVDTSGVIRSGRRRRAATRVGAMVAAAAVVSGGGIAASAAFGSSGGGGGLAAGPSETVATAAPSPSASPSPSSTLPPPVAPYGAPYAVSDVDGSMTGASGDPWPGDGLYWHLRTERRSATGEVLSSRDTWASRERPGLVIDDGDPASAFATGPLGVLEHVVVDGVDLDMLAEPEYLPTDPVALHAAFRAAARVEMVDPNGRGRGPEDQRVFQKVTEVLAWNSGTLPEPLRQALWQVAAAVPGAETRTGTDPDGRAAEIVHFRYQAGDGPDVEYYRDVATGLVIATHYLAEEGAAESWLVVTQQGPTSDIPLQPTLALAGCAHWLTC